MEDIYKNMYTGGIVVSDTNDDSPLISAKKMEFSETELFYTRDDSLTFTVTNATLYPDLYNVDRLRLHDDPTTSRAFLEVTKEEVTPFNYAGTYDNGKFYNANSKLITDKDMTEDKDWVDMVPSLNLGSIVSVDVNGETKYYQMFIQMENPENKVYWDNDRKCYWEVVYIGEDIAGTSYTGSLCDDDIVYYTGEEILGEKIFDNEHIKMRKIDLRRKDLKFLESGGFNKLLSPDKEQISSLEDERDDINKTFGDLVNNKYDPTSNLKNVIIINNENKKINHKLPNNAGYMDKISFLVLETADGYQIPVFSDNPEMQFLYSDNGKYLYVLTGGESLITNVYGVVADSNVFNGYLIQGGMPDFNGDMPDFNDDTQFTPLIGLEDMTKNGDEFNPDTIVIAPYNSVSYGIQQGGMPGLYLCAIDNKLCGLSYLIDATGLKYEVVYDTIDKLTETCTVLTPNITTLSFLDDFEQSIRWDLVGAYSDLNVPTTDTYPQDATVVFQFYKRGDI